MSQDNKASDFMKVPKEILLKMKVFFTETLPMSEGAKPIAMIALLSALSAAAIVIILWTGNNGFVPLYGQQEGYDTSEMLDLLESEGIEFKLDKDSGDILVNKSRLATARMKLAANGVTPEVPDGIETLKEMSGLSTSQFMENNRYNYAVEGELAKTIMTINGVTRARVHLAIPERTLFVGREELSPTASVVLDLSVNLKPDQVEAIVNLVSGSISGLKTGAVSVIDQKGRLLSAGLHADKPGKASNRQMMYVLQLEESISRRAGDMLSPIIGNENFRIRVAADVDFSTIQETREELNGAPFMASESAVEDNIIDTMAGGIPGALSNQPPMPEGEMDLLGEEDKINRRNEHSRRFETGRSVIQKDYAESRIDQISVSVLINKLAEPEGGWSAEELENLKEMISSASGIQLDRGDSITFQLSPFAKVAEPDEDTTRSVISYFFEYEDMIRYGFGFLMFLLLLIFAIRPLVKKVTESKKTIEASTEEQDGTSEEELNSQMISQKMKHSHPTMDLPPPGSELKIQVDHLRMLAKEETPRVADIVKNLINESEQSNNETNA
jgi:flagellar M-ring protein FliF